MRFPIRTTIRSVLKMMTQEPTPQTPGRACTYPARLPVQYTLNVTGLDTVGVLRGLRRFGFKWRETEMSLKNIPIGLNEVQTFNINYSSTPGQTIQVTGGSWRRSEPGLCQHLLSYSSWRAAAQRCLLARRRTHCDFLLTVVMPEPLGDPQRL